MGIFSVSDDLSKKTLTVNAEFIEEFIPANNVIIFIGSEFEFTEDKKKNTLAYIEEKNIDVWDVYFVKTMLEASQILIRHTQKTLKLDNLIIRTHGSANGAKILNKKSGALSSNDFKIFSYARDKHNNIPGLTDKSPLGFMGIDAWKANKFFEVVAMNGFASFVKEGGFLIYTACNAAENTGDGNELGEELVDFYEKKVNILLNTGPSDRDARGIGVYDSEKNPVIDPETGKQKTKPESRYYDILGPVSFGSSKWILFSVDGQVVEKKILQIQNNKEKPIDFK